jgi:hypothetical protein
LEAVSGELAQHTTSNDLARGTTALRLLKVGRVEITLAAEQLAGAEQAVV